MIDRRIVLLTCLSILGLNNSNAQEKKVSVDFSFKRVVNGVSSFDRQKHMTIHAAVKDRDFDGNNVLHDVRDDFLNGRDVYIGRDTGGITWTLNQSKEDESKSGFVEKAWMETEGAKTRTNFLADQVAEKFKDRYKDLIVGAQQHPFWIDGQRTNPYSGNPNSPWALASATAAGEFNGHYLNEFFKNDTHDGAPAPPYFEIMNEPMYDLITANPSGGITPTAIFNYHNDVADAIRSIRSDIKIGGYVAAFPDFEKRNFDRWNERMKLFYDISGEKMDFNAVHFYDFASINGGKRLLRKGGNLEATFDMMEQYSQMKLGKVMPFLVSEYGGRAHDLESQPWSAKRDWIMVKSISPMLLTFLDRPDLMLKTLPFIVVKAEWGRTNVPYPWRLMRQQFEKEGETGTKWVYTDMVRFYDLWKDVNGERAMTSSNDLDLKTDAYLEGNKGYLILSNLEYDPIKVSIANNQIVGNPIESISVKHLFFDGSEIKIQEEALLPGSTLTLAGEATSIITYEYKNEVIQTETVNEKKYYATDYLQQIILTNTFTFNAVETIDKGRITLRLGVGRDHGKSLNPTIKINGSPLTVPSDLQGDDQADRDTFYGLLEIDIPLDLLKTDNEVTVKFPDTGGHIASATLRVEAFSAETALVYPSKDSNGGNNITTISSNTSFEHFSIYPNPTTGIINFSNVNTGEKISKIVIYDSIGNRVKTFSKAKSIDMSNLLNGIYYIYLSINNQQVIRKKIIKI